MATAKENCLLLNQLERDLAHSVLLLGRAASSADASYLEDLKTRAQQQIEKLSKLRKKQIKDCKDDDNHEEEDVSPVSVERVIKETPLFAGCKRQLFMDHQHLVESRVQRLFEAYFPGNSIPSSTTYPACYAVKLAYFADVVLDGIALTSSSSSPPHTPPA